MNWFGRRAPAHREAAAPRSSSAVSAPTATAASPPPAPQPLVTIDALGRKCPIPIIMLAQRINEVPIGSIIAVLADDPAAETDVPAWCLMKSHDHVLTQPLERGWAIMIRRGY